MKCILNIRTLWVAFLLPLCLWASVEQEVLVLFESDVLQMPAGKNSATLNEVAAPQEIIDCLYEIRTEMIIKALPSFNRADTMSVTEYGTVARLHDFSQLFLIILQEGTDRDSALAKLGRLDRVIHVEKNQRIVLLATSVNDERFNAQWNLNDSTGTIGMNVMRAWDLSRGSSSVKIGITDTGVMADHEDLAGKVSGDIPAPWPDGSPHGTQVAGIAAALTNNDSIGIAGVDWYAHIYSKRIRLGIPGLEIPDAINAIIELKNVGCKIINCSWSVPDYSALLYSTFLWAFQHNILLVVANKTTYNNLHYPNIFGGWLLVVSATTRGDPLSPNPNPYAESYTMKTPYVDVGAPGGDGGDYIISTAWHPFFNNVYAYDQGTSLAAPHASGLAGLLLAANSNLNNYELEWIMKLSAEDVDPLGVDSFTGYGIVDAYEAVRHVILPYELSRGNVSLTIYDPVYRNFTYPILPYILPAGYYMCKMVVADIMLNFLDYAETPWGFLSLTGYSPDQPNDGRYWMRQNINPYGAHLTTCFYYLYARWVSGNWVPVNKWVPVDPSVIPSQYTIIGRNLINRPTDLAATALANGNIRLSWSDNSHNELKFLIERRVGGGPFVLYDSVGQNIHTYVDDNVTIGIRYGYQVYAKAQEFTSSYSNAAYATAGLAAPSNLAIINQPTPTSVKLQWQDNSLIEAGFQIARRVDDGVWNDSYKTVAANVTQYTDTVSFMHKYNYKVRAYDNQDNYSEWSNTIEFMSGVLAQSTYSEMSAFNATCKIAAGQNNMLHILADDDEFGHRIRYCISTDGGVNFGVWEEVTECDTNAALSLDANGIPWVVAAVYDRPDWNTKRLKYYLYKKYENEWLASYQAIYEKSFDSGFAYGFYPPSFVIAGDSGFIAFRDRSEDTPWAESLKISSFPLAPYISSHTVALAACGACGDYPVIGYDPAGRIVVVALPDQGEPPRIYWRWLSNSTWTQLDVPLPAECIWAMGTPSLWVSEDRIFLAFEAETLLTRNPYAVARFLCRVELRWLDGNYQAQPRQRLGPTDVTDGGIIGHSYQADRDVVLWNYQNDIYYSQWRGGAWTTPTNISNTSYVSSYPQGITYWQVGTWWLFAFWTEASASGYYLARNLIELPTTYSDPPGAESFMGESFVMQRVYPNPVHDVLKITFYSPDDRHVRLQIFDVVGRMVKLVFRGKVKCGMNEFEIDRGALPAGVYFVRIEAGETVQTQKVVLLR